MTRHADPSTKTKHLHISVKPEWEEKVKGFKEICRRNNYEMSTELYKMIENFLVRHNWPPGHSQFQITEFAGDSQKKLVCERCGAEGVSRLYEAVFISGKQLKECEECFKRAKEHRLVKKFLKVITATHRRC